MPDRNEAAALGSTHWAVFAPVVADGRLVDVRAFAKDPDPSPILHSLSDAAHHRSRVTQPAALAAILTASLLGGTLKFARG